ncbi:MAG: hypothetical protein LUG93_16495 [Lachnospiraceae bacterium]|nr:hypothetical protein [Lachnospiraceae bacterium]
MFLTNKLRVNVMIPSGRKRKVVESGEMTLPARLVRFLFGDGMKVLVITPHSAVGEVVISEMEEKEDETDEG